jgi:hypothetical protein
MSRLTSALSSALGGLLVWLARYLGWLLLTGAFTLGGAAIQMLVKDWTIKSLFTSMMAWPALGLAMVLAVPIAFLPLGRVYLYSALGGGLIYNLILLVS